MHFKANFSDKRYETDKETLTIVNVPYLVATGALMFLSPGTGPKIAVVVSILGVHVQQPLPLHRAGVKRILRYLDRSANDGLRFSKMPDHAFTLAIYAEADWATNPENQRSRSGTVCQLGDNTLSWRSREQHSVSFLKLRIPVYSLVCIC
jgi:hypothetical protein